MLRRTGMAVALIALLVLAAFPKKWAKTESGAVAWPPPPLNARVRFVRTLSTGKEFSTSNGPFLKRALKKIIGQEELQPQLMFPYGIVTDSRGRVIVADTESRALHVFDPATRAYSFIQPGSRDGLVSPIGVATDAEDNIYVTDSFEGKVFVFGPAGKLKYIIGQPEGRYKRPTGIAIDKSLGRLYVADTLKNEIVVTDLRGHDLFHFGRKGERAGEFNAPTQLCLSRDRLYVTDALNARIQIFDRDGRYISDIGRFGRSAGEFDKPKGVALDSDGHIYVVEGLHDVVQIVDQQGGLLMVFGSTGVSAGEFYLPTAIHIDRNDFIYVADSYNHRVEVFQYVKDIAPKG